MNLLHKYKHKIFPNIKDWKDPMDQYRYEKKWQTMPLTTWLFFHPTAYRALISLIPPGSTIIFSLLAWYFFNSGTIIGGVILSLLAARMAWSTFQKFKLRKHLNTITLYDLLFREFD